MHGFEGIALSTSEKTKIFESPPSPKLIALYQSLVSFAFFFKVDRLEYVKEQVYIHKNAERN